MRFTAELQSKFDQIIGKAVLAKEEGRFHDALTCLDDALKLLYQNEIDDAYDWSGWYDLQMTVEAESGNIAAAAKTAKAMLANINPAPPEFPAAHHAIIQDSLVEASLILVRYMSDTARRNACRAELASVLSRALQLCQNLGRDGDQHEFEAIWTDVYGSPPAASD